jgi:putative membrane protein
VVILGDAGIHARLAAGVWQAHVDRIVRGFRAGNAADGVCAVIAELGAVLIENFPVRADDADELPNVVRTDAR